jgi:hypothetical protein
VPPTKAGEPWRKTVLHDFQGGIDGEGASGLALGADGALYGTTAGGRYGKGTVFRIVP